MPATVFVDTNVLLYARDSSEAGKQRRALEWMAALWDTRRGRISVQVLQEYYSVATTKLDPPRRREDAREDVLSLQSWRPSATGVEGIERAWDLQDRFDLSWWDALIVAAALAGRCRFLLSEDFQDGMVMEGLTVIDPFRHSPETVLA
jgi:predicted nucleic acid-binding protein